MPDHALVGRHLRAGRTASCEHRNWPGMASRRSLHHLLHRTEGRDRQRFPFHDCPFGGGGGESGVPERRPGGPPLRTL